MQQSERVDLINRSNYWGITNASVVFNLVENLAHWKTAPNAGWFLWECESKKQQKHGLVLAVTQLYSVDGNNRYVTKTLNLYSSNNKRTGLEISRPLTYNTEAYTVYILKSPTDGRYYEVGDSVMRIPRNRNQGYKQMFSSSTLDVAIESASLRFRDFARMLYFPSSATYCPRIPRFISVNEHERTCVNRIWSLQKLCLFFLRSYIKTDEECVKLPLPEKIKKSCISISALTECNEEWSVNSNRARRRRWLEEDWNQDSGEDWEEEEGLEDWT
jgi:hypothetical protein